MATCWSRPVTELSQRDQDKSGTRQSIVTNCAVDPSGSDMMDDLEMQDADASSIMMGPPESTKVGWMGQYRQSAPDMVQSSVAYQQQDAWKRSKSMPRTLGKQMQDVDVGQGEIFQQFLPGNVIISSSNNVGRNDGVDETNKDIAMGELMVALEQSGEHSHEHDHVKAGKGRQAGGERRYAVPRSHHRPGRLVQADDVENNNASTRRNRPSPRQLLDSYRPGKDQGSTMADQDRGPREDRGYNGGGGRGGFNRKRRYRGKHESRRARELDSELVPYYSSVSVK